MPVQNKAFPNQYADNNLTSSGLVAVGFDFSASFVRIKNAGAGPAYLNLASTVAATTAGFKLSSGETFELRGVMCAGFAAGATSTVNVLEVGAWGD